MHHWYKHDCIFKNEIVENSLTSKPYFWASYRFADCFIKTSHSIKLTIQFCFDTNFTEWKTLIEISIVDSFIYNEFATVAGWYRIIIDADVETVVSVDLALKNR